MDFTSRFCLRNIQVQRLDVSRPVPDCGGHVAFNRAGCDLCRFFCLMGLQKPPHIHFDRGRPLSLHRLALDTHGCPRMTLLSQCRWTGPHTEPGRVNCDSIKLIVGSLGVDAAGCKTCYCRDHEPVAPRIIAVPPPSKPIAEWPLAARLIAGLRTDADVGLGDTIARHLARFGGDAFKRIYKKLTGGECGCADRQAALNGLFLYRPTQQ